VTLAFLTILAVAGAIVAIATQMYSARQQRDFALHELSRAEQVMDINELLLSEVEPQGKALKPGDFIERELKIVEQEHYDNLANHVELLLSIGRQYSTQDLNEKGMRVLREGYDLSRRVTDPGLRGEASCDLARGLINIGKLDEAESLYQEGMRELPGDSLFAQSRVDCLQAGGEIAHHRGESGEEIRLTESALRELYASPVHSAPTKLEVLTDLATMYGDNGKFRESFQTFQEASALVTSLGWEGTRNALKLYNDWAMMLVYAGRPLEAAQRFEHALAMQEGGTPNSALLHNYAASLRFLGRWNDALRNAQQALAVATQQQHTLVVMQSKLDIGSIYREQKRFAESTAIFAELETMMRQNLPPGHFAFSLLTSEESLLAQAQGNMSKALALADQAITIDEAAVGAGKQGAIFLPTLLTRHSGIELAAGRAEQARTDAERAVSLLQSSLEPGTPSAKTGLAYLSLGRALAAQGKTQDAHAKFVLAEQHLTNSLGAEAPDSRIAVDLAGGA
jgi:tetratricopeptide (TPR) repeat protein